MASQNNSKKFEKLVVNALRRLQDIQGSTSKEISDYLSQEYDVPSNEIKKHVRLALRRGVSYGILQQNNRDTYICNQKFLDQQYRLKKKGEIVEPCPWMKSRGRSEDTRMSTRRQRRQKDRINQLLLRERKKQNKNKSKNRKRRIGTRSQMNSPRKKKLKVKSDNCLELLGLSLRKNGKDRKRVTKKHRHRHRTRSSRGKKKKGRVD